MNQITYVKTMSVLTLKPLYAFIYIYMYIWATKQIRKLSVILGGRLVINTNKRKHPLPKILQRTAHCVENDEWSNVEMESKKKKKKDWWPLPFLGLMMENCSQDTWNDISIWPSYIYNDYIVSVLWGNFWWFFGMRRFSSAVNFILSTTRTQKYRNHLSSVVS